MLFQKLMVTGLLLAPEGEGGGGGGGAPADGGSQHSGSPVSAAASPAAPSGDEAPVTRAEFNALMSKLDQLANPPAPAAPAPASGQKSGGDEPPAWAKGLLEREARREAEGRKQRLVDLALAEVPQENRGLAQAVVEGLLVSSGVSLESADVGQVAKQLAGVLKTEHGQLFSVPGSKFAAIPRTGTGGYDFSGVNDISEVPDHMIKHIPKDDYARIRRGPTGGGIVGEDHRGFVGVIPKSRFH